MRVTRGGDGQKAEEAISLAVAHGPRSRPQDAGCSATPTVIAAAEGNLERTGIRLPDRDGPKPTPRRRNAAILVQPLCWCRSPMRPGGGGCGRAAALQRHFARSILATIKRSESAATGDRSLYHAVQDLVEREAVCSLMRPSSPIRQRLERGSTRVARGLGRVSSSGRYMSSSRSGSTQVLFDALLQGLRRALRAPQGPYRQPGLAGAHAHADLEADAGCRRPFTRSRSRRRPCSRR